MAKHKISPDLQCFLDFCLIAASFYAWMPWRINDDTRMIRVPYDINSIDLPLPVEVEFVAEPVPLPTEAPDWPIERIELRKVAFNWNKFGDQWLYEMAIGFGKQSNVIAHRLPRAQMYLDDILIELGDRLRIIYGMA